MEVYTVDRVDLLRVLGGIYSISSFRSKASSSSVSAGCSISGTTISSSLTSQKLPEFAGVWKFVFKPLGTRECFLVELALADPGPDSGVGLFGTSRVVV